MQNQNRIKTLLGAGWAENININKNIYLGIKIPLKCVYLTAHSSTYGSKIKYMTFSIYDYKRNITC